MNDCVKFNGNPIVDETFQSRLKWRSDKTAHSLTNIVISRRSMAKNVSSLSLNVTFSDLKNFLQSHRGHYTTVFIG